MEKIGFLFKHASGSRMNEIKERCRKLSNKETDYEKKFELIIRRMSKIYKFDYYKQYPVSISDGKYYILDFFIPEIMLAFEIDGEIHESQIDYDLNRDNSLMDLGIYVIRFKNKEVLSKSISNLTFKNIGLAYEKNYIAHLKRSKVKTYIFSNMLLDKLFHMEASSREKYLNKQLYRWAYNISSSQYKKQYFGTKLLISGFKKDLQGYSSQFRTKDLNKLKQPYIPSGTKLPS